MKNFTWIFVMVFIMLSTLGISRAVADNWTINFSTVGDADHIVLYHKPIAPNQSAQNFVNGTGFTEITLPVTSPQNFTIDYPDGTNYGIFGKVFDSHGDSSFFMNTVDGDLSPTVWKATALPAVVDAHYEVVVPSVNGTNVVNITINQGR